MVTYLNGWFSKDIQKSLWILLTLAQVRGMLVSRVDSDLQANALSIVVAMKLLSKQVNDLQADYDILLIENEQQREELYELRKLKAR